MSTKLKGAFAKAWQSAVSSYANAPTGKQDLKIMQDGLLERLLELDLSPAQVARILSAPGMSMSIVFPALKAGLFGPDWFNNLASIFQTLIDPCIGKCYVLCQSVKTDGFVFRIAFGRQAVARAR